MHRVRLFLVSVLLSGVSAAAHATPFTAGTYTLQDAVAGGYSVTGTVTFNSAGSATAANLVLNTSAFDNPTHPTFNTVSFTSTFNGLSQSYLTSPIHAGQIALYVNTVADTSGHFDLCLGGAQCGTSVGTIDPSTLQLYGFYNNTARVSNPGLAVTNFSSGYLQAGTSTPVAATPEPSTLVLLGTGLCGLWGAGAARFRRGHSSEGDICPALPA